MIKAKRLPVSFGMVVMLLATIFTSYGEGKRHFVHGNTPAAVKRLRAMENLSTTNQLHLAIALPLRNQAELDALLKNIYNPASPSYHQYLTPAQFAEKFGPAKSDYQTLIKFAEKNGLKITGTHANRVVLDVAGSVADIEKTFQVKMQVYNHPKERRTFYSPDTEPSVDASMEVSILSISGLNNYSLPKPASLHITPARQPPVSPTLAGSGPGGTFRGLDFRAAYVPNSPLNGTGQSVALLEFDGYYSNDIAAYEQTCSLPYVTLTNVPVRGGVKKPGSANDEVSLDIELAIAMAPNLSRVVVYEEPVSIFNWPDILSQIADDDLAAQISCSWFNPYSPGPDPASEQLFQQMASQGQSFFSASGDADAFDGQIPFPDDSPNVTIVGGTMLTTGAPLGPRLEETVWNQGGGIGTGGGVSIYYPIPSWQQGINTFLTNGGSTVARNIPDVALTAENIWIRTGNGSTETIGGTSCAAPLWAGFMALVNQQALAAGKPLAGFINPAIYEIGNDSFFNFQPFNDITMGNNTWTSSPNAFFALPGYDLCTGFGTPNGTNLINALVNPDPLIVVSNAGFNAIGSPAGTFNLDSQTYYLTNIGASSLDWSLVNTSVWLDVSNSGGTLATGASDSVMVSLNPVASTLAPGTYSASLWFSNMTSRIGHSRFFTLKVSDPLVIAPQQFILSGPVGGPFVPNPAGVILTNASGSTLNWGINNTSSWFNVSPTNGSLLPGSQTSVAFVLTPATANLPYGPYTAIFQVTNLASQFVQTATGLVMVGIVQNGGFETGDFSNWTLAGDANTGSFIYNEVVGANTLSDNSGPNFIHSGSFGAFLGDINLAYLSQTIPTVPGQNYLLSFWFDNPMGGTGQQFLANWNTNNTSTNQIYLVNDPGVLAWQEITLVVQATDTNATLQFGAENLPDGFGLDDIDLIPVFPPVFTARPATNLIVVAGSTVTFSAAASGSAPLAFQWYENGANLTDGDGISGTTTTNLMLTGVTTNSTANYTLVVTNSYGSITSCVAALTVILPPGLTGVTANPDGSVTLNLAGSPGFSYVLESTTNFVSGGDWLPVATNVFDATGVWQFNDVSAPTSPQRFYRLKYTQ
jgi:Pro-kumamolisin, activation domain/Immunoglobulin I-set domain/Subtilase family/Viral BACON domain